MSKFDPATDRGLDLEVYFQNKIQIYTKYKRVNGTTTDLHFDPRVEKLEFMENENFTKFNNFKMS